MKRLVFLILISSCAAGKYAVNDASKAASTITTQDLKKHLTVIASAEMEGRETGTAGQRKAALYIESQFKAIGLEIPSGQKGYQQYYPLKKDSLLSATFTANGKTANAGTDFIANLTSNENSKFRASKIVFVGYGIDDAKYSDYTDADVNGNIVAFVNGEPKNGTSYLITGTEQSSKWTNPGLGNKLQLAKSKGAIGAIVINNAAGDLDKRLADRNKVTNYYYPEDVNAFAVSVLTVSRPFMQSLAGTNFDVEKYLSTAKQGNVFSGPKPVITGDFDFSFSKDQSIVEASNVIGVIPGATRPDEYVFITAHYDHLGMRNGNIYYGADDDGSGTVAVIEMAEAFMAAKKMGKPMDRTMVFMTVSGEEKGLWGSKYYSDHPIYPLAKTSADLNIDMVGRIDTERKTADTFNYVYVVGHDKLSSDLPILNEYANKKSSNLVLDYKYDDPKDQNRIYFRSDHYNFARKGVPVLFFYDGMLKADYHKTSDTVDKIEFELYKKRVDMIFHTAWSIANKKNLLKRNIPLPATAR